MGCLLIAISAVLFFVFPPLGIAVFFIGLAVMVMNRRSSETAKETAKQTAELKRIALLSAPPEVQKAEAEKAQRKCCNFAVTPWFGLRSVQVAPI